MTTAPPKDSPASSVPDGKLYAIWSQDDAIMLTTSRDGGKTFSHARAVIHTAPIMFAIQTLERANGFPQIAIDPKSKRLYVTWSDYRNGDLDVFLATSDDGGKHWTTPVRVNNDPGTQRSGTVLSVAGRGSHRRLDQCHFL